ncbi:MAG: dodecin family protein [Balneolaceae bacterium]
MESVVKVIELLAQGDSVENAIENGVEEASRSIRGIKSVYVKDIKAMISDNKVETYRLVLKVSFQLQDQD